MVAPIDYASLVTELQNLRGGSAQMGNIQARQDAIKSRLDNLTQQSSQYTNTVKNGYEQQRARQAATQQAALQASQNTGQPNMGGGGGGAMNQQYHGGGAVDGWITKALGILGMDNSYVGGIRNMIMKESGGNPNAINKWDSNWKAGHPSMGLMQTIQPTFNAWKMKGYDNVYDPVANILAGVRYAQNRYGNDMLRSGGRKNSSGKYIGY